MEAKEVFSKNLTEMTGAAENVAAIKVFDGDKLVSVIPSVPGKAGSVRVYSHFGNNHDNVMTLNNIQEALMVYEPFVAESKGTPGKHPAIDLLLKALELGKSLRVERIESPVPSPLDLGEKSTPLQHRAAVKLLNQGKIRCAEKIFSLEGGEGIWTPQLYAIDAMNAAFNNGTFGFKIIEGSDWDKVPMKTQAWFVEDAVNGDWHNRQWNEADFKKAGVRFIPGSFVRYGSYVGSGTTVMPGAIVNTGAYIGGANTMIDGGARVATGAQIGKGVKLGAGSGLEGIIEPRGRLPTIVEDGAKIGANCEVAGIVEEGAILGSGVVMASGKKIYDLRTGEELLPRVIEVAGKKFALPYIPAGRVAVAGTYDKQIGESKFGIDCILLLEKDAKDTAIAEIPPNAQLYTK